MPGAESSLVQAVHACACTHACRCTCKQRSCWEGCEVPTHDFMALEVAGGSKKERCPLCSNK